MEEVMAHKGTELLNAVLQELKDRNVPYRVDKTGRKHVKIRFEKDGRHEMVVISRSPSEGRAVKNACKVVTRILDGR